MNVVETIKAAHNEGHLRTSTVDNLKLWLAADYLPTWTTQSISELVEQAQWEELNDRFYQN